MSAADTREIEIPLGGPVPFVSALITSPAAPKAVYVFAHGAGAGMRHTFMESVSNIFAEHGVATLRFQFPYMQSGRTAPNPPKILKKTIRSAFEAAADDFGTLPIFAGGKSMGGRMTSMAVAESGLDGVAGLVFFGFPLHAAGKPSSERGDHLRRVGVPMFFAQGTRDRLADLNLLKPLLDSLPTDVTLLEIDDGDHSLKVPKRSGRTSEEVLHEVVSSIASWMSVRTRTA